MSLKAEIVLEWADGEYLFALKGAQIEELQHVCGKIGFGAIFQRVTLGVWHWGDLYHTIRLGLIGGGMGAVDAKRLTDMYVGVDQPGFGLAKGPNSPESVARAVLQVTMFGIAEVDSSDLGEPEAGR